MKQTALEFFVLKLVELCGAPPESTWIEFEQLLKQAKELEEKNLIFSFMSGMQDPDQNKYQSIEDFINYNFKK